MVQYRFEVYDFAHYSDECHKKLDAMCAAGWRIRSASPNFAECSVLWERGAAPGTERDKDPASQEGGGFAGGAGLIPDPGSSTGVSEVSGARERREEEREREQEERGRELKKASRSSGRSPRSSG